MTPAQQIVSPILVGRTVELGQLEAALRKARQGQGQVVLLAGEAGVGKSRLVAELRQRAVAMRFALLEGYCFEQDINFPYAPLVDALRAFFASRPADEVVGRVGPWAADLAKIVPELARLIPNLQLTPLLNAEAEKRRLFETLVQFIATLSRADPGPLLLILEDIHWSDETSLDFLHLLARRMATLPILLLLTYRHDDVSTNLQQLLTHIRHEQAEEIMLQPLTRSDVGLMLQALLAMEQPVHPQFLQTIYTLTEGNPFFTEEVLKSLIAAGAITNESDVWQAKVTYEYQIPRSIQDAVQRRTEQLSEEARQLLALAAVTGQRFDFAVLQQARQCSETELLALIKELIAAQLVAEESSDHFTFRHALTRQAVYSELLARERRMLHRTVAQALESLPANRLDAHAGSLAYHWAEAGEWAKTVVYAQRAGERAQAFYAPHAAREEFTRAITAAQQLGQAHGENLPLLPLYRSRSLAYAILGEFEAARADLDMALAQAQAANDQNAEWQLLLDLGMLWSSRDYQEAGRFYRQALAAARRLEDSEMIARSLNRVGNWHTNIEEIDDALHCHHEALDTFQQLNHRQGLAQTYDLLGMASLIGGDSVQAAALLQQAVALEQLLDDRQGLVSTLGTLSLCSASYVSEMMVPASLTLAEAFALAERARQIAVEIGWRAGEAYALTSCAYALGAQGEYGRALEALTRGTEISHEIGHRQWLCHGYRQLGAIYLDLLALPLARHYLSQSLALAQELGSRIHTLSAAGYLLSLCVLERDMVQAEVLLNAHLRPDLPMQTIGQRRLWLGRAELALAQGEPDRCLHTVDQLLTSAANLKTEQAGAIPILAKVRGEALTALQRGDEAETVLLAGRATAHARSLTRLIWRLDIALGKLYQAQQRSAEATTAFATAHEAIHTIAFSLPNSGPTADVRENFLRQSLSLFSSSSTSSLLSMRHHQPLAERPAPPLPAGMHTAGLTLREIEVLRLVAQGATNRQIGTTLHISERTVNTHLTNILNKIGCDNRTAAAAFALQHGLV